MEKEIKKEGLIMKNLMMSLLLLITTSILPHMPRTRENG